MPKCFSATEKASSLFFTEFSEERDFKLGLQSRRKKNSTVKQKFSKDETKKAEYEVIPSLANYYSNERTCGISVIKSNMIITLGVIL